MGAKRLLNIYDKHYKKLMLVSVVLLVLSIGVLGYTYATTGELFKKGVSLSGGITLTIPAASVPPNAEAILREQLPDSDIAIRTLTEAGAMRALIIEAGDTTQDELIAAVQNTNIPLEEGNYNVESMGSSLGDRFFQQTVQAVILAFLAMGLVVFITFRAVVPSLFVMLAAISDLISTLAVVDLLGVRMSTAGIAAFLMLIGYSVDTDILLTTRVLKRRTEGTLFERTVRAMRTGMIMSLTSLSAALAAYIFAQSDTIKQIMLIIVIGLFFDIIYTWIQNAGILRWWMEKKYGKH